MVSDDDAHAPLEWDARDVFFEDSPLALGVFDAELRFVRLNARMAELNGASREAHLGKRLDEVVGEHARTAIECLQAVQADRRPRRGVSIRIDDPYRGGERRFLADFHPVALADQTAGVAVLVSETTESERAASRAAESEARLRHVLDASMAYMGVLSKAGILETVNAPALLEAGLNPAEVVGKPFPSTYWWAYSEEAQRDLERWIARAAAGEVVKVDTRIRVGPDRLREVIFKLTPVRDGDGAVAYIVPSAIDVNDLVEARERQALLAAELNHRVKNILAIVRALVTQTARRAKDKDELARALEGRIGGMARTVASLTRAEWSGHGLADILGEQLRDWGERVSLLGPNLALTPKAALGFGLIAYELMSNAAKHGALSADGGRVLVAWRAEGDTLEWRWEEQGGPPASPPQESGFGSLLVRSVAEGDLSAEARFDYAPSGLRISLRSPLRRIATADALAAPGGARESPLRGATVLLAEGGAILALDLVSAIESAGAIVIGVATDTAELHAMAEELSPDLIVAAARLAPAELAALLVRRAALVLVGGDERSAPEAVRLAKPFSDRELIAALESALIQRRAAALTEPAELG